MSTKVTSSHLLGIEMQLSSPLCLSLLSDSLSKWGYHTILTLNILWFCSYFVGIVSMLHISKDKCLGLLFIVLVSLSGHLIEMLSLLYINLTYFHFYSTRDWTLGSENISLSIGPLTDIPRISPSIYILRYSIFMFPS